MYKVITTLIKISINIISAVPRGPVDQNYHHHHYHYHTGSSGPSSKWSSEINTTSARNIWESGGHGLWGRIHQSYHNTILPPSLSPLHCAYSLHNHQHYVQLWTSASEPLSNLDYLGFPPTGGRWWKSNWFDRNNLHINIFTHRIQKIQKKKQRKCRHLVRNYPLAHPCDWCEKQIEVGRALTCHALSKKIRKTRKLENIIRIIALMLNLCKTARLIQVVFGFASKWDIISDLTNTYIFSL